MLRSDSLKASDVSPNIQGCCSQFAMMVGWKIVAGKVEEVCDRVVDGRETLKMSRRLEALHDPLPSSDGLMGVLRSIVQSLMRTVFDAGHDLPFCRAIGA